VSVAIGMPTRAVPQDAIARKLAAAADARHRRPMAPAVLERSLCSIPGRRLPRRFRVECIPWTRSALRPSSSVAAHEAFAESLASAARPDEVVVVTRHSLP